MRSRFERLAGLARSGPHIRRPLRYLLLELRQSDLCLQAVEALLCLFEFRSGAAGGHQFGVLLQRVGLAILEIGEFRGIRPLLGDGLGEPLHGA